MVYYLFLSPNVTDTNAIIDYFEEKEAKLDWDLSKRKVTVETEERLDLLNIFKELGVGNLEYYEEEGDKLRVHGQYVAEHKAIKENFMLALFGAGTNF